MRYLGKAPARVHTAPRCRVLQVSLVVLALLAAACGSSGSTATRGKSTTSSSEPASTRGDDTSSVLGPVKKASGQPILIGFITDGHNQVTDQSVDLDVAAATVKYLNTHRGGIGGRPIKLVTCEAQLDPAKGTDCSNQMVEKHVAAVVVGTTGVVEAVWKPLHDAHLPTMFFAGSGAALADTGSTFSLTDPNGPTAALPIVVAQEHHLHKVTVIVIDVPPALQVYQGAGANLFREAGIDLKLVRVPPGTADMTAQLQPVVAGDPGEIHVLGNDAFCIAAFQGLQSLGFHGPISAITQCISDATRKALPGKELEGIVVGATSPVDANDENDLLYRTVMKTFGSGIDTSRATGHGTFTALAGFAAALEGMSGPINSETITKTIKAMPKREVPDGGGLMFQCNGAQVPDAPASCVSGSLVTTLDAQGRPTQYRTTKG